MKSTNVRQLMNLLSQKYFGNELNYPSNKSQTPILKNNAKNQDSSYNIVSPVTSCKTSPKFNRLSSSQGKPVQHKEMPNENFNYFEQTKNYFDQTRAKFKKPQEVGLKTGERKKLELRDSNLSNPIHLPCSYESGSELEQQQGGVFVNSYSRKSSEKELMRNSSGSYLNPVTFSNISPCQNMKNTNKKLVKESFIESKGPTKKLFLKENSSSFHKLQSNSTISNSRGSVHTKKENAERQNFIKKRDFDQQQKQEERLSEEVQFYRSKCLKLEQQNSDLRDKVSTYEEQFAQQKQLVENLKQMMSHREREIDEILEKRLTGFEKKEQAMEGLNQENETLKRELEEVREVLKQQEGIIMELYAQSKHKQVQGKQLKGEERSKSLIKGIPHKVNSISPITTKNTSLKESSTCKIRLNNRSSESSNQVSGCYVGESRNSHNSTYGLRCRNQVARQSITETSYEEDQFRVM